MDDGSACYEGYELVDSICVLLPSLCSSTPFCHASRDSGCLDNCAACYLGYYLSEDNGACTPVESSCGTNEAYCDAARDEGCFDNCVSCYLGYYLNEDGHCTAVESACGTKQEYCDASEDSGCFDNCAACYLGYYLSEDNGACTLVKEARSCSAPGI